MVQFEITEDTNSLLDAFISPLTMSSQELASSSENKAGGSINYLGQYQEFTNVYRMIENKLLKQWLNQNESSTYQQLFNSYPSHVQESITVLMNFSN